MTQSFRFYLPKIFDNKEEYILRKFIAVVVFLACSAAQAGVVTLDFTASNLGQWTFNGYTPIAGSVTGQFKYVSAAIDAPIESLVSVDLLIGGHQYTTDELSFDNSRMDYLAIGAASDVFSMSPGTNDFWFIFGPDIDFSFATTFDEDPTTAGYATSNATFAADNTVPEPATWGLLAFGLVALAAFRKKLTPKLTHSPLV